MDIARLRQELKEEFEREAEWRREKAVQHPNDQRNLEAASEYDRLAVTVALVPDELIVAYWECFEDNTECEILHELIKRIFHEGAPPTATEFVQTFVSRVNLGVEPARH